jgi:hypothetical protein
MLSAMMAAAALLAAEAPPPAQPSAPETTASPATVTAPPKAGTVDKTVCKNEPIMGTRMTKKVCYSPEERARAMRDERMQLEHMQFRK